MPDSKMSSTAKKLVQAAALTAMLVPLGSVMMEASTITCSFGGGGCTSGGSQEGNFASFDFGAYELTLRFDAIDHPFSIAVENFLTDQGTLTGSEFEEFSISSVNRLAGFPGQRCIPLNSPADGNNDCVEFIFSNGAGGAPPEQGDGWSGGYDLNIFWSANTDPDFPGADGQIHVLHNVGNDPGGAFDEDLCVRFGCTYDSDPGVGTRGDGFFSMLVTSGPGAVPEPGSVLLIATGLGALCYGRRRRQ